MQDDKIPLSAYFVGAAFLGALYLGFALLASLYP
jgi:hypothetical protein